MRCTIRGALGFTGALLTVLAGSSAVLEPGIDERQWQRCSKMQPVSHVLFGIRRNRKYSLQVLLYLLFQANPSLRSAALKAQRTARPQYDARSPGRVLEIQTIDATSATQRRESSNSICYVCKAISCSTMSGSQRGHASHSGDLGSLKKLLTNRAASWRGR